MKRSLLGPFFQRYGWWHVTGMAFLAAIPQAQGGTYADMHRRNSFVS